MKSILLATLTSDVLTNALKSLNGIVFATLAMYFSNCPAEGSEHPEEQLLQIASPTSLTQSAFLSVAVFLMLNAFLRASTVKLFKMSAVVLPFMRSSKAACAPAEIIG